MSPILLHLHLIPAALYSVLGLYFWRVRAACLAASPAPLPCTARFERVLLVLALLAHALKAQIGRAHV